MRSNILASQNSRKFSREYFASKLISTMFPDSTEFKLINELNVHSNVQIKIGVTSSNSGFVHHPHYL